MKIKSNPVKVTDSDQGKKTFLKVREVHGELNNTGRSNDCNVKVKYNGGAFSAHSIILSRLSEFLSEKFNKDVENNDLDLSVYSRKAVYEVFLIYF